MLAQIVDTLDNVLGASSARKEIDSQLSPAMSASLQSTLRGAAAPRGDVKALISDTFGFFTNTGQFLQIHGHLAGEGPQIVMWIVGFLIVFALLLVVSMMFDLTWLACQETMGDSELINSETGAPHPKYSKVTHRCACCILAFSIGDISGTVSNMLSGACLITDDMSLEMIQDAGSAFNLDFSKPQTQQLGDILDQRFVPRDRSADPALLDVWRIAPRCRCPRRSSGR